MIFSLKITLFELRWSRLVDFRKKVLWTIFFSKKKIGICPQNMHQTFVVPNEFNGCNMTPIERLYPEIYPWFIKYGYQMDQWYKAHGMVSNYIISGFHAWIGVILRPLKSVFDKTLSLHYGPIFYQKKTLQTWRFILRKKLSKDSVVIKLENERVTLTCQNFMKTFISC